MVMRTDQLDLTKDDDILTLVEQMRTEAESGNRRRRERMRKCRRFRVGDQWDDDVKAWYKSGRKHALTINLILPTILQVAGVHSDNKKDITVRPTNGGTDASARIISSLLKFTLHHRRFHQEHTDGFRNAIGDGAGYLMAYRDFEDDPKRGNLAVRRLNPFSVLTDPSVDEYNMNTSGQYVIWDEWMDEERAKLKWPDKANEITVGAPRDVGQHGIFASIVNFFYDDDDYHRDEDKESVSENRAHKVRITHTWWKEWKTVVYLYRVGQDDLEPLKLTKSDEITEAKKQARERPEIASVSERIEPLMHHTQTNRSVFLEDVPNPWAYEDNPNEGIMQFPIVPIYAYYEDGYIFSLVENLISPQEEHNFARSTLLNISKKLANTGWIGKGLGTKFREWLQIHSGQDGVVIDMPNAASKLDKIEPTQIPTNQVLNAQMAKEDIGDIANVKLDRKDFSKSQLTNQARAIKERDSLIASNTLFSNDEHSILILGEFLVDAIRNTGIYSETEIKAIVDESDMLDDKILQDAAELLASQGIQLPEPPVDIQQQVQELQDQPEALAALIQGVQQEIQTFRELQAQFQQIQKETAQAIILEEIKTLRSGKYGTMIDQQSHSPTMRIANFIELLELHKVLLESNYAGIPREQLIEASDAPNKAAIIATPAPVQPQETALEAA